MSSLLIAVAVTAACGDKDNSADTDKASKELRQAQTDVLQTGADIASNRDDIEQRTRDLQLDHQTLADKQKLLEQQRQDLGAARGTLQTARAAYAAAVDQRLAKLDASLATLSTKTDARSKDAAAGLRARRDLLALKVGTLSSTPDADWSRYTSDVDVTFDAIERDLHDAQD
ncbi:MAG TPA: hypothetical protein VMZ28_11280 [Kofleriaceae bacterium]|nr:hypothetical protein [Kofleriaceae bacterium]